MKPTKSLLFSLSLSLFPCLSSTPPSLYLPVFLVCVGTYLSILIRCDTNTYELLFNFILDVSLTYCKCKIDQYASQLAMPRESHRRIENVNCSSYHSALLYD